jgi:VanZ family protein
MKPLPYWLALFIACLVVAGGHIGFHFWRNDLTTKTVVEALVLATLWGIIMHAFKAFVPRKSLK